MAVLNRELSACYTAAITGAEPELPDLSLQYADYSLWQHGHLQGAELQRQLEYWKSKLGELPQLGLATDKPRPAYLGHEGGSVEFALSRKLCDSLLALSRQNGVTPFMLFLAAFSVLLLPLQWTDRYRYRDADRWSYTGEVRGSDRFLCQHAGYAK